MARRSRPADRFAAADRGGRGLLARERQPRDGVQTTTGTGLGHPATASRVGVACRLEITALERREALAQLGTDPGRGRLRQLPRPACSHNDSTSRIDRLRRNAPITIARSGSVRSNFAPRGNSDDTNGSVASRTCGQPWEPSDRRHGAMARSVVRDSGVSALACFESKAGATPAPAPARTLPLVRRERPQPCARRRPHPGGIASGLWPSGAGSVAAGWHETRRL